MAELFVAVGRVEAMVKPLRSSVTLLVAMVMASPELTVMLRVR